MIHMAPKSNNAWKSTYYKINYLGSNQKIELVLKILFLKSNHVAFSYNHKIFIFTRESDREKERKKKKKCLS